MSMMGPFWVTIILLATQVTCSLAVSCDLPYPLNSTQASKLLREYNDAGGNSSCSGVTVLQLIEFKLNTTGNTILTKSTLNWTDTCLDHFKFTFRQVALINGKMLDQFPGSATMDELRVILTSDATKSVVQDVNNILKTLADRNVSLDATLDFFIKKVGFIVKKGTFLSILCYSLKSYNESSVAVLLGYDQRLVNATLPQAAEYLLLNQHELQKKLTVECLVRHLQATKTFILNLLDYVKEQRDSRWAEKTVIDLVVTENITILTAIKKIYQGNNLTFFQFYGERKVELVSLDFTIAEMSVASNVQIVVIKNYTISGLFTFVYEHSQLLSVYKKSLEASKTMRERILKHYHIVNVSTLEDRYNLTTSQLDRLTDVEFENYAIRYYIYRYTVKHLNTNFGELETFAKLTPGSLENATVKDFQELMSKIGVAYAIKAINQTGYLKYLLDHQALEIHVEPLREQIKKDRQPLTTGIVYQDFAVSYLIYLNRLRITVVYEQTIFTFTESLLVWDAFVVLFNITDQRHVLQSLFMQYTFKEISIFFGVEEYIIFTWDLNDIIKRLLYLNATEIDECALGRHTCYGSSVCQNYIIGGYRCICPVGYNVDLDNNCKDVDECKLRELKNGGCDKGECMNTYGSFKCSCPTGYKEDNVTGNCVDIHECNVDNPCINIADSECMNKVGGYECRCKKGYNGTYDETVNPRVLLNCTDINECDGAHSCVNVNNSQCVNRKGSYGCRCKSGFMGTFNETASPRVLLKCEDIHECNVDNPCINIADSECMNKVGGYECRCKKGYNGTYDETVNPRVLLNCTDINECDGAHSCVNVNNSQCVNRKGSYGCRCKSGFMGTFNETASPRVLLKCEDKNECASIFENRCFPNARCRNLPGSYECYCDPGYEFNQRLSYCKDKNECDGANSCTNITNSKCVNKRGSYECRCKMGFNAIYNETASPKVLQNCTDIDECSRPELNRCHKNAKCTNLKGNYNCSCKEGYKGDGYSCKENRVINPILLRLIYITRTTRLRPFLGFYYGGRTHSKIYISTNGLISIGKRYRRSSPKSCEIGRLKKDLLAPFWASAAGGFVGYQQFAKEDENAAPVLNRIDEIVDQTTNLTGFKANWALVVAWQNIIPRYCWIFCWLSWRNPYRDETNDFQAVLTTNGSASVVLFLYADDGMNWHRRLNRKAMVGYSTKSGQCKEYEGSFTESIFDIDDQWFTDPAGTRRKGVIVNVFSKENVPPTPEEQCLSWIRNQPSNNEWIEDIPSCPCTLRSAQSDSRFEYWSAGETSRRTCYAYIKAEYTKTCCYFRRGSWRRRGALITNARLAGRVVRYSPISKEASYREQDEKPFKLCCVDSSKYCGDFSQYRPVEDSCSNQEPQSCSCQWTFVVRRRRRSWRWRIRRWWQITIRRAWFFGDPHITTLDGFKYSFNGLGDYVLLSTSDKSHILHGKTVRPPYKNTSELSNATVFSGFAMRNKKNTTVQVLYNNATPGDLSILVNSINVCQTFNINDLKSAAGFILKKSNDTLIVMFEDSGFAVEITPGIGLLQISFSVPPALADKNTTGLLGKLNGDKNDDLNYPNGTTLLSNSTDKEIFAYGQTWKVQDGEDLFMHENCTKLQVFFDGNFRPTFLSDFNRSAIDPSIIRKCKENDQCILDILLTGNEALGLATLVFDEKNDEKRAAMDNLPPDITVTPESINVKVGQMVKINVTAKDPNDGDMVTLTDTGSLPIGATFDNITGVFSWTPSSNQQNQDFKIEFVATDQRDAAQVKSVAVNFCDCKNDQECDFTNILRSNPNNSFALVGCNCSERYSGDDCGTENMPCAEDPCYDNVNCTAKAAPEYGYTCGPCPVGLVGDGENCNDYDECANASAHNCNANQTCINTIGSYRCQCKQGYTVKIPGGNCTDVDECLPGFGINDCGANSDCTNTLGGYNCTCKKGYEGNPKQGCTDINECLQDGRCNHNCANTAGSFNCTCFRGYKLNQTSPGYYTCTDINECEYLINNDCGQICTNVPSDYLCSCRDGYRLDSNNKTCTVKTPCAPGHGCTQECIVLSGNQCGCQRGYELSSDNKTCSDIDECSSNRHGCAHNCTNAPGNYSCSCLPGYKLMSNKRGCEEIDECKTNNGDCEQKCTNTAGSRRCSCKRGYQLDDDKMKCKDINECMVKNRCNPDQRCQNKKGGYKCRCPAGQFTDGENPCKRSRRFRLRIRLLRFTMRVLTWRDELNDEFSDYYISVSRIIIIEINKFFKTRSKYRVKYLGCKVNGFERGSIIANVSLNFDPSSNVTASDLQQEVGTNAAMGDLSYDPGQSSVSDVNECNDPEENNCDKNAICTNTDGSFTCTCKDGYSGSGVECIKMKDKDDMALIIGLSVGLSLLVIIIIIVIVICCYRRNQKGRLHVTEEHHVMTTVYMKERPRSGEVYYGDNNGRRGSNESVEGQYDIATATANYYDNPGIKKDGRRGSKESVEGQYDIATATANYYDNPTMKKDPET